MLTLPWNWKQIGLTDFVSEREETGRRTFLRASPDTFFAFDWRWPEGVADLSTPLAAWGSHKGISQCSVLSREKDKTLLCCVLV